MITSRLKIYITLSVLLAAASLSGCAGESSPAAEQSKANGSAITLSKSMDAQLVLSTAGIEPANTHVSLTGKVDFDPNSVTHVYSLVTGIYNRILVNQGDAVHKGQVLAEVYSSDIANAVSDFQKSAAALRTAQKNLTREQELLQSKVASHRDLEQAESDEAQAQADYDRSLKTLKLLGGNEKTTSATYEITSPIAGVVLERFAQPGSQVRNDGSQAAFTVGSTASLWISLDAYPDQLRAIGVGDSAIIRAAGSEDHPITTTIQYVNPVVDPSSFTTKVRCMLPNSTGELKPMMFVSATVLHRSGSGLYVPASAAFFDADGKVYVFRKRGERTYEKIEVQTGRTEPSRIEITSGLASGDTIVADNALFLNDELKSDEK